MQPLTRISEIASSPPGYSAIQRSWPSAVIIRFSVGPPTEFCTSSARALAVNEIKMRIAQLNAKKKGLTSVFRAFCSFVFIINFNSVLSFKATTRAPGILFQNLRGKSRLLPSPSREMPHV